MKKCSACIAFAVGCPRSRVEVARLFEYFQANGWEIKESAEEADLVLVATCGVDGSSEEHSMKYLSAIDGKRKAGSQLVVLGCLAGINEPRILDQFDAILVPPAKLEELDRITGTKAKFREIKAPNYLPPYYARARRPFQEYCALTQKAKGFPALARRALAALGVRRFLVGLGLKKDRRLLLRPDAEVYTIKAARGCLEECAYCAIRFAAGPLHSEPLANVLAQFDAGLKEGYKDFEIIAADLGPYGQDIGTNILELLQGFFRRKGNYRVTLTDINVKYLIRYSPEILETLAEQGKRIVLKVPIQSGSERILGLMQREYTAASAKKCLSALCRMSSKIFMVTHVLIGFPGETEEDFEETLQFLREIRFNRIDTYLYTDRPKTKASQMAGKVSEDVKKTRRSRLLREFSQAIK